jgi:four helix bundle protein
MMEVQTMVSSQGFRDLRAYQMAFDLAMKIFQESKKFPAEERYSLTDQIRRVSRSVAANIGEGYRKKRYPKMFVSKWQMQTVRLQRRKSG